MKTHLILISIVIFLIVNCHQPLPPEYQNLPPEVPADPYPVNNQKNAPIELTFHWECSDPNLLDSLTYEFYLEKENPSPGLYKSELTDDSLTVDSLEYGTQYFWKVIALDSRGGSAASPVWCFRTRHKNNLPPLIPSNPVPANNSTSASINKLELKWQGGDPDSFSLVSYKVMFGSQADSLSLIAEDISDTSLTLKLLMYDTDYFWQIEARDDYDSATTGPLWRFHTIIPDLIFTEPFDSYSINENPPAIPLYVEEVQADIFVTDQTSCNDPGNSLCFTDSTLGGYCFLATRFESKKRGLIQFYWKVMSQNDYFGVRLYSEIADTTHIGPQVSIRQGKIQYYDQNDIWQTVEQIQTEKWYFVQLLFDCEQQFYNIYLDGKLKISEATWAGSSVANIDQIYFLTFQNRTCKKAFVDEIEFLSDL